jgi:acetyl esterase/lipase
MRHFFALAVLAASAISAAAQEKPKIALRHETKIEHPGYRITVFIENLTDQPITLRDSSLPSFEPWPWLNAKVDGKEAVLQSRSAYAQRGKFAEKLVPAKSRFRLGELLVVTEKTKIDKDEPGVPILTVPAGDRTIALQLKEGRGELNGFGNVPPIVTRLEVQPADVKATTYTYKTVGDLPIKADVYRRSGDEARPALVWIHGGALIVGQRGGPSAEQRKRYLDAGFVIVSIDYRLAPETKLKGIIEDVQDAFKWVREKGPELYKVDPKRVAVVGHSAGGYLTLMSGFAVEPRPQALVAFYGYGDIDGDWYAKPDPFYRKTRKLVSKDDAYKAIGTKEIAEGNVKGRSDFYMYCRQNGLWPQLITGHDPAKEPRAFDRFCPVRNVTKEYPPTFLVHGDADTDVPHQQSVDMAAELKKHGVPHEFVSLKGMGHGFDGQGLKSAQVAAAFARME